MGTFRAAHVPLMQTGHHILIIRQQSLSVLVILCTGSVHCAQGKLLTGTHTVAWPRRRCT